MRRAIKKFFAELGLLVDGWAVSEPVDLPRIEASQGSEGFLRLLESSWGEPALRLLRGKGASVGREVRVLRGLVLHNVEERLERLRIGDGCHIGRQVFLDLAERIEIGNRVTLSMRSMILTHMDAGDSRSPLVAGVRKAEPVIVEDDVYVGAAALVLPGVTLGRGCVVGAGAVVTKDVAPEQVVVGVPAAGIRRAGQRS